MKVFSAPPRIQRDENLFAAPTAYAAFGPRLRFDLDAPPLRDVFAAKFADILDERLSRGTEAALVTALRLSAEKPGNIHYNLEYVRQLLAAGTAEHAETARQILDVVLELRPDNALALALAGYSRMQRGEHEEALRFFSLSAEADPADAFARINAEFLRRKLFPQSAAQSPATLPPITIATSLPPQDIKTSRLAVDSWRALGFRIVSVNTEEECRLLEKHFPDADFCVNNESARALTGRDHQYLDALLDALAACDTDICGIVNADIVLRGGPKAWAHIADAAREGFVFGPRVNLRSLDYREGRIHSAGFDIFFFPKSFLARVPRTRFIIGQPFWDLFFPVCAQLAGLKTHLCLSPVALHKTHEIHWNDELFIHLGFHLLEHFAPALGLFLSSHTGSGRYFKNTAGILSETTSCSLRGAAAPLFCPGAQFAGCVAPVDPFYWTGAEKTLIVW